MKNIFVLIFITITLHALTLIAEIKLIKQETITQTALNIGYLSLTESITDFNQTVKALKNFAEDATVDVIVININSPGGSPGSSQIISDFILWVRKHKPVIAFISDSGTSGAYWIAAACTHIIAPSSALIGSIGVVLELPKENKNLAFTAGRYKRTHYLADGVIDPHHTEKIQERLDILYDIFCTSIAHLREIPVEKVKNLEAQVFLGPQALKLGLIDQIGTIEDVFNAALEMTRTKQDTPVSLIRIIASPTDVFEFAV